VVCVCVCVCVACCVCTWFFNCVWVCVEFIWLETNHFSSAVRSDSVVQYNACGEVGPGTVCVCGDGVGGIHRAQGGLIVCMFVVRWSDWVDELGDEIVGLPAFSVLRVFVVDSMWHIRELILEILCGGFMDAHVGLDIVI
jgi:hypothetical protein